MSAACAAITAAVARDRPSAPRPPVTRRSRISAAHRAIFADLSFVRVLRNGDVNFWNVTPTGDHAADCETGDRYAEQLLAWLAHYPTRHAAGDVGEKFDILKEIAFAMPRKGARHSIEVGFWTSLSLKMMDCCGAPAPAPRDLG